MNKNSVLLLLLFCASSVRSSQNNESFFSRIKVAAQQRAHTIAAAIKSELERPSEDYNFLQEENLLLNIPKTVSHSSSTIETPVANQIEVLTPIETTSTTEQLSSLVSQEIVSPTSSVLELSEKPEVIQENPFINTELGKYVSPTHEFYTLSSEEQKQEIINTFGAPIEELEKKFPKVEVQEMKVQPSSSWLPSFSVSKVADFSTSFEELQNVVNSRTSFDKAFIMGGLIGGAYIYYNGIHYLLNKFQRTAQLSLRAKRVIAGAIGLITAGGLSYIDLHYKLDIK